jgi:hypothetical protein
MHMNEQATVRDPWVSDLISAKLAWISSQPITLPVQPVKVR